MYDPVEVKALLEEWYDRYDREEFIADDPISIPHAFTLPQDIEISGLLAATIAWGNRRAIVHSARRMMNYLDGEPYDFTMHASDAELARLRGFVHRTFNGNDLIDFILSIRRMYLHYGGIGAFFERTYADTGDIRCALSAFRACFFHEGHAPRCRKHLSSIDRGASCKRLNMYLRWMIRRDERGVDFGLWQGIPMSALYLPLDLHTGNVGRALGLLVRRQNDWKAVEQITQVLRGFDPDDPVRYDYALFGAGITGFLKG